jgi:2-dehydropantoate 2-reductase
MRMIVIGTGPIGGIIGGRLARAGHDLTFVDVDQEHIEAIREKGVAGRYTGRFLQCQN